MAVFLQTGECTDPLSVDTAINAGQTFIHLVALLRIRDLLRKEKIFCQCHILPTIQIPASAPYYLCYSTATDYY